MSAREWFTAALPYIYAISFSGVVLAGTLILTFFVERSEHSTVRQHFRCDAARAIAWAFVAVVHAAYAPAADGRDEKLIIGIALFSLLMVAKILYFNGGPASLVRGVTGQTDPP